MKKLTKEEFVLKAIEVHGNKYDYSKVEYVNARTKVCIICPIHGEFWQTPDNHIYKHKGCPICNGGIRLTTKSFIEKSNKVHNNKFDYSKVVYKNNRTNVYIICPEHGEFWQTPDNHLNGHHCPKCNGGVSISQQEFIEKAKEIHGDKYNYSKVEYINSKTKVCIICPEHGEFWQTPSNHLAGKGCLKCKISKLELLVKQYLNKNNINYIYQYRPKFLKHGKGQQSLDFYIPDLNIGIECQGIQHYIPVDFGGKGKEYAMKRFKYVQRLDERKKFLCIKNNIRILYINDNSNLEQELTF